MQLWNFEEIEKKGQDTVDIDVNQFMRDGNLIAHPLHNEGELESDIGLWKARSETIIHKGSTLVRVCSCPMVKLFGCKVQLKIEEGLKGLLMLRHRWHDGYSHADPNNRIQIKAQLLDS
jgi:hypothetical protein